MLGTWPIAVIPDAPPTIRMAEDPTQSQRAAVRIEYESTDDYGIETVAATIALTEEACMRCAVKYGVALNEALALADYIREVNEAAGRDYEVELSLNPRVVRGGRRSGALRHATRRQADGQQNQRLQERSGSDCRHLRHSGSIVH